MMCERESLVAAALKAGGLPEELRVHVESCAECRDAVLVFEFLAEVSEAEQMETPPAGLVWFKSQLRLRREAAERAERPLVWGYRVAAALAMGGMIWASIWVAGAGALMAATLIGSVFVLGLTAGGLLMAARDRGK
jgi:hypothetical protein